MHYRLLIIFDGADPVQVEEEDEEFVEEFLNEADPSILHFLIAS